MIHEEEILTYIVSSLGANLPAELRFYYDTADPFAINIDFGSQVWTFGRDLLAEALVTPGNYMHGEGDVQVQLDHEWVRIFLTSPEGTCQVRAITQDLIDFVNNTVKIVGPEEEESKIASAELDDVLSMILNEAEEV